MGREAASAMARSVTAANSSSRWLSMMSMVPSIRASSLSLSGPWQTRAISC